MDRPAKHGQRLDTSRTVQRMDTPDNLDAEARLDAIRATADSADDIFKRPSALAALLKARPT